MRKTEPAQRVRTASGASNDCGFTLLELIASLSLFAIIAAFAIPSLHSLTDSINKRNAEIQVLHDIRYAQAATVEQGCRGIFSVSGSGKSYTFGCDYVPYSPSSAPVRDKVLKTQALPTGISLALDSQIIFNSRGQVIDGYGTLTTRSVTLKVGGVPFSTGTLRPTGFFEYTS